VAQSLTALIKAREDALRTGRSHDYARFLVTGHGGCGKTTELYRLQDLLSQAGFAVVYFDAGVEFDLQKPNVDWWSILLGWSGRWTSNCDSPLITWTFLIRSAIALWSG
jgi:hypothetical protein